MDVSHYQEAMKLIERGRQCPLAMADAFQFETKQSNIQVNNVPFSRENEQL